MRAIRRIAAGMSAMLRSRRAETELDEELRAYLAASIEQKVAAGLHPDDALRQARAEMGSSAAVKDWVRDVGWESRVESVWQDVRYAMRVLRRSPGFAAVAILSFALGIGVNTALFSIVDAVMLKPLPFEHADRLVDIFEVHRAGTAEETLYRGMTRTRLAEWRSQSGVFDAIEAYGHVRHMKLGDPGASIQVARVSSGLMPMLGFRPSMGRNFSQDETAGDRRVVLISNTLWTRAFGGSQDIIGREIRLENRTLTVIGVMPAGARRFPIGSRTDAWLPLADTADPQDPSPAADYIGVVARLREGLTPASARTDLARAAEAIQRVRPSREPWTAEVETIDPRSWNRDSQPVVLVAFGAAMFVLLTACVNVASLLLTRVSARQREIAIRRAIGASRGRIARQLLVESLVLSLAGGAAAITLAGWLILSIPAVLPPRLIYFTTFDAELDWRVIGAAFGMSLAAGIISGVLPALRASSRGVESSLTIGAAAAAMPSQRLLRNTLVAVQVALAAALVVGAGLMASSFVRMVASDAGYRVDGLQAVSVSFSGLRSQQPLLLRELVARVRAIDGITEVTVGTPPPQDRGGPLFAEDRLNDPDSRAGVALLWTGPDYFRVLGIRILRGRAFTADDRKDPPDVAVIDEETARKFWPGQEALGKRVRYSPFVPWLTVVGVAEDVKTSRAGSAEPSYEVYLPEPRSESPIDTILFRTDGFDGRALAAVKGHIAALDKNAVIRNAGPVRDLYGPSLVNPRFTAFAMSAFAALALLTAAIGVYGTLSYVVARRTREIGIRVALGASHSGVKRLIVMEALMPVGAGLLLGLAASQALARFISSQLYETTTHDPVTLTIALGLFTVVALAAAYVPARRTAQVDPIVTLRAE